MPSTVTNCLTSMLDCATNLYFRLYPSYNTSPSLVLSKETDSTSHRHGCPDLHWPNFWGRSLGPQPPWMCLFYTSEPSWKECPFSKQCIKFQAREWKTSKIDNLKIKASSLYIKAGIHTFKCLSGYNFIVLQGNRTLCRQTNSGQSRCGLVNLRISQLAKTSDLKFAINNHYKFDLQ